MRPKNDYNAAIDSSLSVVFGYTEDVMNQQTGLGPRTAENFTNLARRLIASEMLLYTCSLSSSCVHHRGIT